MQQPIMATDAATKPTDMQGFRKGVILRGIVLSAVVVLVAEILRIFVGTNFHVVQPGKCYRSAQPTPSFLEFLHRRHGIKSVINLRGDNPGDRWFDEEAEVARKHNMVLYDAGLSSIEQAPKVDFAKFIQAMKDAEEPILIHCANGNDRSGFAAGVYFMLRTDMPVAQARTHLTIRYGHIPWSRASCLGRIFDSYESWLATNGWQHTPARFHHWGTQVYEPEP